MKFLEMQKYAPSLALIKKPDEGLGVLVEKKANRIKFTTNKIWL